MDSPVPFCDPFHNVLTPVRGVVKLVDIPYSVTKTEIIKYLGATVTDDFIASEEWGPAIHIIMERTTGKTMDCYIELEDKEAAEYHIDCYFGASRDAGGAPKIGNRRVHMELASHDELLHQMFPRAKCIQFTDGKPLIVPNTDAYSTGFQGYVTSEELFCLWQQATIPTKYPYSSTCPQRVYEAIIDLLWKFPWTANETYTLGARNEIVATYLRILQVLVRKVEKKKIVGINQQLLCEYIHAGLNCRGFSERQRGLIKVYGGQTANLFPIRAAHIYWPFDVVGLHCAYPDEESCTVLIPWVVYDIANIWKFWLNVVEKGVHAVDPTDLMPEHFYRFPGRLPSGLPTPIAITFFEYRDDMSSLSFAIATKLEILLSQRILAAGLAKLSGEMLELRTLAGYHAQNNVQREEQRPVNTNGYREAEWRAVIERRDSMSPEDTGPANQTHAVGEPGRVDIGRSRRASNPNPVQPVFNGYGNGEPAGLPLNGHNIHGPVPHNNLAYISVQRPDFRANHAIPIVDPSNRFPVIGQDSTAEEEGHQAGGATQTGKAKANPDDVFSPQ